MVLVGLILRGMLVWGTGHFIAPYAIFFPIVVATAIFMGSGPAILTIVLTAVTTLILSHELYYSTLGLSLLGTSLFVITSLLIVWLCERQRNAINCARKAQGIASDAERRAGNLVENLSDGFIAVDRDWHITYINAAAMQLIFGDKTDLFVGQNLWKAPSLLMEVPVQETIRKVMSGQLPGRCEQLRVQDDRWFDLRIYPQNGSGLSIFVREITEEKRSQHRIVEQEEWLRMAIVAGDLGTFDYYPEEDRIIWTPRVYEMYGLTVGQPMSLRAALRCIHPDDRVVIRQRLDQLVTRDGDGAYVSTYRVVHPDGSIRWLRSQGKATFTGDGENRRIARMVGTTMDVTDRVEAEAQRSRLLSRESEAREAAEHTSKLKDEFLSALSHELRTPLNAILGWVQLLRLDVAMDDKERAEGMGVIERNARAQLRMIEDLLDMNRLDSGRIQLRRQKLDLVKSTRATLESVMISAQQSGIQLELIAPVELTLMADEGRVRQMLLNLLDNSIKFTPRGGHVQVRLSRQGQQVQMVVTDTGQGITAEFLPHLFERFRQADSSISRRHGGLGLGLGIARQIVILHGGTITATSEGQGKGTTFTIVLPVHGLQDHKPPGTSTQAVVPIPELKPIDLHSSVKIEEETIRAESSEATMQESAATLNVSGSISSPAAHPNELDGLRILVVDDEPDARELLQKCLGYHGAAVLIARSADEGVAMARRYRPNLIISDIGMSGRDGYQMIAELRQLDEEIGGQTPAIALTAFARQEDRQRALAAGYQAHLAKPVESDRLVEMIGDLAARP